MKLFKLFSLFRFQVHRLKRNFGFKTKWEMKDWQANSRHSWEGCMLLNGIRVLKRQIGVRLMPTVDELINEMIRKS